MSEGAFAPSAGANIVKVQSITGAGTALVLNGVGAGNAIFVVDSYIRNSHGSAEAVPTDSNGAFLTSIAPTPITLGLDDLGVGIFHQLNVAGGTHTVTPQANTLHRTTLVEVSGIALASAFDVSASASTSDFSGTSQVTGTTGVTAQANELVLTALVLSANLGVANVGLPDPIVNYITLQIFQDETTSMGMHHSYQVLAAIGAQSATENWTDTETHHYAQPCIAAFKAPSSQ